MMKICGVVALYMPTAKELANISSYIQDLDYCLLVDDSGIDNITLFRDLINNSNGKVEYILNDKNKGLCKSVNNGLRIATKIGADWALVMNPDGTFENGAVAKYRDYIEENPCDNVAALVPQYNFDRHPRKPKCGTKEVDYADMGGTLYNLKVMSSLDYYDENTYFYGLDTEYCLRVRKIGYKIIQILSVVLNHNPAHTEELKVFGKTVFKYGKDNPIRYYYQFRTGYYLHSKYHSIKQDAFIIYKFFKVLFLFDQKRSYLIRIIEAYRDNYKGFYGNYNERTAKNKSVTGEY